MKQGRKHFPKSIQARIELFERGSHILNALPRGFKTDNCFIQGFSRSARHQERISHTHCGASMRSHSCARAFLPRLPCRGRIPAA